MLRTPARTRARRAPLLAALLCAALAAALIFTGCAAATPTPNPLYTKPAGADFPISLTQADGTTFTIAAKPVKIVSLPVWSTEELFGMVDVSRVAAISSWTDDPNTSMVAETAKKVATRVKSSAPEAIIALRPDLVILDNFNDFDGSLTKTLRDAGIPTLYLAAPATLAQVEDSISILGAVIGEIAKAGTMRADMQAKLDGVAAKLATLDSSKRLSAMYVYASYNDATMFSAYNSETPIGAIMVAAGLVNVCDAPKYSDISKEKVVSEWKPQAFLVPSSKYLPDFSGTTDDGGASAKASILADATLKDVPAVVNGRVFSVPDKYMTSTSQYMADAVVRLAEAAYPDLFK